MKSLMIAFFTVAMIPTSYGGATQKILKRFDNPNPRGQEIEIKNVDYVQTESTYQSHVHYSYHLDAYLWVKPSLVEKDKILENTHIILTDVKDEFRRPYSTRRVGFESDKNRRAWESYQGFAVYRVTIPVDRTFSSQFYARFFDSDHSHYSNWGRPKEYFELENIESTHGEKDGIRVRFVADNRIQVSVTTPTTSEPITYRCQPNANSSEEEGLDRYDRTLYCEDSSASAYLVVLSKLETGKKRRAKVFKKNYIGRQELLAEIEVVPPTP